MNACLNVAKVVQKVGPCESILYCDFVSIRMFSFVREYPTRLNQQVCPKEHNLHPAVL